MNLQTEAKKFLRCENCNSESHLNSLIVFTGCFLLLTLTIIIHHQKLHIAALSLLLNSAMQSLHCISSKFTFLTITLSSKLDIGSVSMESKLNKGTVPTFNKLKESFHPLLYTKFVSYEITFF